MFYTCQFLQNLNTIGYMKSCSTFLVTHDNHFNILKRIDFPKIQIANIDEFAVALKGIE